MPSKIVKKPVHAPECLNEPGAYHKAFSRGLMADLGGFSLLFISGTASLDHKGRSVHRGDFKAQARRTFRNIKGLLDSEGATWHDVMQTRCYLKHMRKHYGAFNDIRNAFYKQERLRPFPASVCVEANLCRPELLVEIEAIAIIKKKKTSRR